MSELHEKSDELALLTALALMCDQYLSDGDGGALDHQCMGAGERAVDLLTKHGLIEPRGRGGTWTTAGKSLLDGR